MREYFHPEKDEAGSQPFDPGVEERYRITLPEDFAARTYEILEEPIKYEFAKLKDEIITTQRNKRTLEGIVSEVLEGHAEAMMWRAHKERLDVQELPEEGEVFVDMNDNAMVYVGPEEEGKIWTGALGGCTGIAGIVRLKDGSAAMYVSHHSSLVDMIQRPEQEVQECINYASYQTGAVTHYKVESRTEPCLSERLLYNFVGTTQENAESIVIVVAYDESVTHSPEYGDRQKNYGEWYFLDQLEQTAAHLKETSGVEIILLPYQGEGNSLEAQVTEDDPGTIYFNDEPIVGFIN